MAPWLVARAWIRPPSPRSCRFRGGNTLLVWLYVPLVIVHVIVAVALVLIVLLQAGKGAELGAAFGGASLTIFSTQNLGGSVVLTSPAPKPVTGPAATPPEQTAPGASSTPAGAGAPET